LKIDNNSLKRPSNLYKIEMIEGRHRKISMRPDEPSAFVMQIFLNQMIKKCCRGLKCPAFRKPDDDLISDEGKHFLGPR